MALQFCLLTLTTAECSMQVSELIPAQTRAPVVEGRDKGAALGRYKS